MTQKTYADATPYGGARILGALVDDAPIDLEHARLQRTFWLERSRVLTDVKARNICVDGELSFAGCFVAGRVEPLFGGEYQSILRTSHLTRIRGENGPVRQRLRIIPMGCQCL